VTYLPLKSLKEIYGMNIARILMFYSILTLIILQFHNLGTIFSKKKDYIKTTAKLRYLHVIKLLLCN